MTVDSYKEKFGIPKNIGLICKDTFYKLSAASKEKFNDTEYKEKEYKRLREIGLVGQPMSAEINKIRPRLKCEENALKDVQRRREIPREIIVSWIEEMKELQLTPKEYFIELKGENILFYNHFFQRINRFDLNKEYEELWEALPTHKSVASSKITKKTMQQIIELYEQLIPQNEIAAMLNIAPVTVRGYLKLARKQKVSNG
jgi:DNA-binding CsgD family transcriptional regulator